MKRKVLNAIVLLAITSQVSAQKWNIDKSHSKVTFSVTHLMISEVEGKFKIYNGSVQASKEDFSDAQIDFSIDVNSIDTDDEARDKHLKGDDFFAADKYPTITFKSKQLKKVSGNNYQLKGDLTIKGVTKPVDLNVVFGGIKNDPWGNTKAGFKVTGIINRKDFGLTWNAPLEAGGVVVGEDVKISCNIELAKAK